MKRLGAAALALALSSLAPAARAQDADISAPAPPPRAMPPPAMPGIVVQVPVRAAPPSDPAARLASLEHLVGRLTDPARRYRVIGGATAISLGVVTVPMSAVMLHRGTATEVGPVLLLGLGAGEIIGAAFVLATPGTFGSGYAPVLDRIAAGKKAGEPATTTLEGAEHVWHERAVAAYEGRRALGGVALVVGAIATGLGIALDVASPLGGLDRADQDGFSAAAFGVGYAAILSGVRTIAFPTPLELTWQVYRGGGVEPVPPTFAQVALAGVRAVPVQGGAGVGWGRAF